MKILIIGFAKIKYMPYLNLYLETIDREKNDVHVIYWSRDNGDDRGLPSNVKGYDFGIRMNDEIPKYSKITKFLKFRRYTNRIIKKEKFDFIICLTTIPAIIIKQTLVGKYRNRYILDYRDSTYEKISVYKKLIGELVKCSKATVVSSDAYRRYLPGEESEKIFTAHNFLTDSINHSEDREACSVKSDVIRIAFWGFIRHEETNMEIIKRIASDKRFQLHYYGREQQIAQTLKNYVKNKKINNVFFHGEYKPEDRYEFMKNTDVIHNIYDNSNMRYAMSNKYYDGIIFKIPQVCMQGSYMGEIAEKSGVGIALDPLQKDFTDKIYDYLIALKKSEFKNNCGEELNRVIEENNKVYTEIKKIIL